MKSPMISIADYIAVEDKDRYSDMQVLKSGAGYYVGTIYSNPDGYQEPGSRDSGYFATEGAAAAHLKAIEEGDATTRLTP